MYVSTQGQSIDLTKVYNAVKLGRYARLYSLSRQVSAVANRPARRNRAVDRA